MILAVSTLAFRGPAFLPRRFAQGLPLNRPVPETFYSPGSSGYTDYPTADAA